jgi:hypothetical protein
MSRQQKKAAGRYRGLSRSLAGLFWLTVQLEFSHTLRYLAKESGTLISPW